MRIFLFSIFILVFCNFPGLSRDIHFHQLGSVHGLSQSSAISIWQDSIGRIWIGNDALNCYDGEKVKVYRLSEYFSEIEDADLHTITGNDSVMFVIAENNLIYMDLSTEKLHLTGITTSSVCCVNNRAYYFADNALNEYDWITGKIKKIVDLPESIVIVRNIMYAGKDKLWLGTPFGVFIVDIKTGLIDRRVLEEEDISRLFMDSQNYIWIISRSRKIFTMRQGSYIPQILSFNPATRFSDILCIEEDTKGTIWLGTLSGMYQITRDNLIDNETASIQNYVLPEASIYALLSDRQGTLWIGSYYGDVRYFNPEVDNYVYYATDENHNERLHGAVIGTVTEDKNKNIYIATEGSGINILYPQTGKFTHLNHKDGLNRRKIRYIWNDEQYERLYISEYMHGLSYYDINDKRIHPLKNDSLQTIYQRIIEQIIPYQHYLVLRTQDGIFKFDRRTQEISKMFDDHALQEYCSGIIRALHIDSNNTLWVSSYENGLFTIDLKNNIITRSYGDGLRNKSFLPSAIINFCENKKKGLFMTTLNSGILAYDPENDNFIRFTEQNNDLLSDICYNICFSWYDNLVVTTNKGISILNLTSRTQLNSVHHIPLSAHFPLVALSGDCGLYSSQYSDRIYVGGLYGLLSFSERDLVINKSDYSLYFSSLSINSMAVESPSEILQRPLQYLKKITLSHHQNTISLDFASSNYLSTRDTPYEYRMEGIDEFWNVINHKTITYNSLRPGKYKLYVREAHNRNKGAEIDIIIKRSIWATAPAIMVYVIFLSIIILLVFRFFRSRTLLKASLENKEVEIERIEEANRNKMDFFINISNEFRTPLTLILSQLDHIIHETPTTGKKKLDKIKTQALRLQDLINELYDFRKMEQNKLSLHVQNEDLNQFLRKIYLTYTDYAADKQITYRYNHPEEALPAWFDPKQLQKVIYNLLTFVFRYASRKDSILVSLSSRSKRFEIDIQYNGELPDPTLCDYFFSFINGTSNQIPDLSLLPEGGLGIIFSKGIVQLHQGEISVEQLENNITFHLKLKSGNNHFSQMEFYTDKTEDSSPTVSIPEVREEFIETDLPETLIPEKNGHKKLKMLLLEDHDEVRLLLKEIFSFNYEVIEMQDSVNAYQYALSEAPDIILCEIMIPGTNGIELCTMLKNDMRTLHIPVILLTSQPSEKQQIESIRSGADDYIVKPFNVDMLILRCNYLVKTRKRILENKMNRQDQVVHEVATNTRDKDFLLMAKKIAEENIGNPEFDTSVWSKQLGVGRTRLFSQIKQITGMTPNDYILQMKLNKSLVLLAEHNLTIGEIGYQLGFSSPAYFSKCFKKQYGMTPADYRKKL